jgi:hypothetical protein
MISFLLLLVLAAPEPVSPAILPPESIHAVADTVKPKPAARPTGQGSRDKPPLVKRPDTQRGKPTPKPTGDPRLKRRKPPELHSPRVP